MENNFIGRHGPQWTVVLEKKKKVVEMLVRNERFVRVNKVHCVSVKSEPLCAATRTHRRIALSLLTARID
jgi:excinuclease UvrABC nuclease subunit